MKNAFNDNAGSKPHHYILRLSRHAREGEAEKPFQRAIAFLQRLEAWAKAGGHSLKGEVLPVTHENRPRLRLACTPEVIEGIVAAFGQDIREIDEIPLPRPNAAPKSIWKRIFG